MYSSTAAWSACFGATGSVLRNAFNVMIICNCLNERQIVKAYFHLPQFWKHGLE
jgi:hypothetical protein